MHPRRLTREILERIERVAEYHRSTKLTPDSIRANPPALDPQTKPNPYRCFDDVPSISLPNRLIDASVPAVPLLAEGLGVIPKSHLHPPQDLRTLATWLFLANGLAARNDSSIATHTFRTCPSSGGLYPFELYVAAFGIEGLEPGLYHYNVRDFSLCKLRDGDVTLASIKRGRPDLNFLKSVPATLLVSTNFWRSAWRYRQRGYRMALLDAGHLVQNLVTAANGLGIATNPRLLINDKIMRELIGVSAGTDFGAFECVQAMVVWADSATRPMLEADGIIAPRKILPRIRRRPLSSQYIPYGSIVATHEDCIAPGFALRDIRSPVTDLSPIVTERLNLAPAYINPPPLGPAIRQVFVSRRSARSFADRSISRDQFLAINRLAFRGGSIFPMMPDGPHIALVRPYWVINLVAGMDAGVWYYDPAGDRLACTARGDFHLQVAHLCCEQKMCGHASAVCFLVADLRTLAKGAGPDTYRLAHLEAGVAGQRIYLATAAMGLGCCGIGAFYDDEVRQFLGLAETGWEPIYAAAVGHCGAR